MFWSCGLKSWGKLIVLLLILSSCAGCFRIESLIKLSQDGSGSIFVRCLLNDSLKKSETHTRDMGKFAGQLGEGVTFVETQQLSKNGWSGVQHEFAFEDINKIKLGKLFSSVTGEKQDSAASESSESQPSESQSAKPDATPFALDENPNWKFTYKRGETNELIVYHESNAKKKEQDDDPFSQAGVDLPKAPSADINSAIAMAMVRPLLTQARASMIIQVDGEIVSTNAAERTEPNGNAVYLIHFDFSKFAKSKAFEKAMAESWSMDKLIKEKVPGIQGPLAGEKVSIRFKGTNKDTNDG